MASAETILFVPQDNRPVSYAYTVSTAESAGYRIITPPEMLLSDNGYQGNPDEVWNWLNENASQADAMVLSTDTLIYGGLVDSRKHHFTKLTLERRAAQLKQLHQQFPHTPIYAFGTVMRSPRASNGSVEPFYYANYGPQIYEIAYWQDKQDTTGLTAEESAKLLSLTLSVPIEYLQDWFSRRSKNNYINQQLMNFTREGVFTYFCLGHDDNSGHSQSALENRYLKNYAKDLTNRHYGSFPGADQLGLLLMARYHVDLHHQVPKFAIIYTLGGGGKTIPHYEDQTVEKTIAEHIEATGGVIVTTEKPNILLAVNTPLSKTTKESETFANLSMPRKSADLFLMHVQEAIQQHIPVTIADIFYSNGSDNTLLEEMEKNNLLYQVSAYNGWNTASNTIGFAIAQAILSENMSPSAKRKMLTTQYLDNWGYQANIRKEIYREQESIRTDNVKYYGVLNDRLQELLVERIQSFAQSNLHINPRTVTARFPWQRLFEVQIFVSDKPQYELMSDVWKARESLRKEAEKNTAPKTTPAQNDIPQTEISTNSEKDSESTPRF